MTFDCDCIVCTAYLLGFNHAQERISKLESVAVAAVDVCDAIMWEDEEAEQEAGDRMAAALNVLHGYE